jgi:hypothetical protein
MGINDHSYRTDLPAEAGDLQSEEFDPNNKWITKATEEEQIEAMRRWFYARYEDPVHSLPYDGKEGGYQFIWGSPADPDDKIQQRFSGLVPHEIMRSLIEDLWDEAGDEWAPIDRGEFDYDEEFVSRVTDRDEPLRYLQSRVDRIDEVLSVDAKGGVSDLMLQMAHGSIIATLEAFLAETVTFWIKAEKTVLRDFVTKNPDFRKRALTLSDIFARLDQIDNEIEIYLQELMWHRLDKIKPMLAESLGIVVPDISQLMKAVLVRHDIVHRAGRRKDGLSVSVTRADVEQLRDQVLGFARAITDDIDRKYPHPKEEF